MGNLFLFLGGLGGFELLLFTIIPLILWIWALLDCLQSRFGGSDKLIWVVVIILLPVIGSILYLVVGRKQKV
jgi:hypothetical protein